MLFVMRHSGYVRNFESTLRMLCERGHAVHLAFQGRVKYAQLDPIDITARLAEQYPTFSSGFIPLRLDGWGLLGRELRLALDYLRYLTPEYRDAPKLRGRAERAAPPFVLERVKQGMASTAAGRRVLGAWLRAMERAIPRDPGLDDYLREQRPDVLALTPLIEPGSPQVEYVRSARALGIPTAFLVASWDNLTNKGLIHCPLDRVAVWNEMMKREAIAHHGVPPGRVVVTGAAAFDHWFDWKPTATRDAFCARVGLPPERPYLLYLCSSKFVAPQEAPFVRTWAEQIRRSESPALREAGILIRPHPQNAEQWQDADLSDLGPLSIWPRAGAAPVDADSRGEYFDSMYHSAGVVGINTTAEIESAILGRRVFTVLTPEFRDTQEGTLHFHHLRQVNGGLLHAASGFDEHLTQLDAAVHGPQRGDDERCRRFVEAFVRPFGRGEPATPRLVELLEALAAAPRRRAGLGAPWAPLLRRRLRVRSEQLERDARAARAARAAERAAKAVRDERRRARLAWLRAREAEKERKDEVRHAKRAAEAIPREERLEGLVAGFRKLGEVDRRSFFRAVVDRVPKDSFIELHAATPPRPLDYEPAGIVMRATTEEEEFRLRACAKEPFTVDWIHSRIGPGDVLYDIGANVGAYSLVAAMKPGGGAHVYAFEPGYANVASLAANVVLNGASEQVTPLPIALADRTEMNVFRLRDLQPGAAMHVLGDAAAAGAPTVYRQPVMTFRLDDAIELLGLRPPNHIKLDVDGGELAVLEGATRTLASPSLQSMLVEVSTSLSGEVTEVLERHGLRLDAKIGVRNKAGQEAVWYGLFARNGKGAASVGGFAQFVSR